MPITLNHTRGENQIVQQVDFGTGDILITKCRDIDKEFENQLWLIQGSPKPKEEWETVKDPNYKVGTNTDDMPVRDTVVLAFSDRDSITALVRSLMEVYNQMPGSNDQYQLEKPKPPKLLDEKGFVFIDPSLQKPYWVTLWSGEPWLFYWHADKRWVSYRRMNQTEIWLAYEKRINEESAEFYHNLSNREN